MNPMLWPTALAAAGLFWLGCRAGKHLSTLQSRLWLVTVAVAFALPGVVFAAYYGKLLGEPIWLYKFRALPGSELTASGAGLLAGFGHSLREKHPVVRQQLRRFTVPAVLALLLVVPYVKPIVRPLNWSQLQDQWDADVCLQSTPSTCGPASAATLCRRVGKPAKEADLARESFTYAGGTENWHLARALRRRGMSVAFLKRNSTQTTLPTSTIAGVTLTQGTGHFIALLERSGTNYIVGDPLEGREELSLSDLMSRYKFTGFFMEVR